jgi:cell division initiation protein
MRLTPLDIRKQEFKRSMRGLDIDEVRAFLATVADEYEAVINDNKALRERLLELDDKVQEYRNMEKTLRDTLLTAERVTVEAKDNARREAELIVKEAQIEAERAGRDVRNTAVKLRQEIQTLKQQKESYLSRLRVLIESHMKFVEAAERDLGDEERRLEDEQRDFESKRQTAKPPEPQKRDLRDVVHGAIKRQDDVLRASSDVGERGREPAERTTGRDARRVQTREVPEASPQEPPVDNQPSEDRAADLRQASQSDGKPTPDWSLDRLKRDILAGTARTDEEDI